MYKGEKLVETTGKNDASPCNGDCFQYEQALQFQVNLSL
jgi:hypothetical protein